jgi:hypothetical protein
MLSSFIDRYNANEGGKGGKRRVRGVDSKGRVLSTAHYAKYILQILDSRLIFQERQPLPCRVLDSFRQYSSLVFVELKEFQNLSVSRVISRSLCCVILVEESN